jgi:hypothetical protein
MVARAFADRLGFRDCSVHLRWGTDGIYRWGWWAMTPDGVMIYLAFDTNQMRTKL